MSHLIDRLNFFRAANAGTFADGHGVTTAESRGWEDAYRKRWQHEPVQFTPWVERTILSCCQRLR